MTLEMSLAARTLQVLSRESLPEGYANHDYIGNDVETGTGCLYFNQTLDMQLNSTFVRSRAVFLSRGSVATQPGKPASRRES